MGCAPIFSVKSLGVGVRELYPRSDGRKQELRPGSTQPLLKQLLSALLCVAGPAALEVPHPLLPVLLGPQGVFCPDDPSMANANALLMVFLDRCEERAPVILLLKY